MRPEHISVWTALNLSPPRISSLFCFGDVCNCCVFFFSVFVAKTKNPLLPSVFSPSFPHFNMQIDVCKILAYLHMTPGTQLVFFPPLKKTKKKQKHKSAVQFSAPQSDPVETVWLLLAHNKMIIFILSSTLLCLWCAPISQTSENWQTIKTDLLVFFVFLRQRDRGKLKARRKGGVYLDRL